MARKHMLLLWLAAAIVPAAHAGEVCEHGDLDFNNDGIVSLLDVEDFFRVSSGGDPCSRGNPEEPVEPVCCDSLDFNRDGVFPSDQDAIDFLSLWAGGPVSTCP